MNNQVLVHKDTVEEIESFLRVLERHSATEADLLVLREAGLSEAANVFANALELALEQMRENISDS